MILFVTGTSTGVGKTVVACAFAKLLRQLDLDVGVAKPIAAGSIQRRGRRLSQDVVKLMRAAGRPPGEYDEVNPVLFGPPVSPHLAARLARRPIDLRRLREHIYNIERRSGFLLVEGVGGVATPLSERLTWADFMADFRRPKTVLVCSPRLGTLNHTLMSLEFLSRRKVECLFLVLSNYDPKTWMHRQNRKELARLTHLPVAVCDIHRRLRPGPRQLLKLAAARS